VSGDGETLLLEKSADGVVGLVLLEAQLGIRPDLGVFETRISFVSFFRTKKTCLCSPDC
jgi:hypothetical protein